MSRMLLLLTTTLMCGQLMVAQQPAIKRLDSSTITTAEIDATIVRLMRAAK